MKMRSMMVRTMVLVIAALMILGAAPTLLAQGTTAAPAGSGAATEVASRSKLAILSDLILGHIDFVTHDCLPLPSGSLPLPEHLQ